MISKEEAAIYDRQIRLWGLEAQTRIKNLDATIIGFDQITCEISKNLLLAGIKSLNIIDDSIYTPNVDENLFLADPVFAGKKISEAVLKRAQELNPMVSVKNIPENRMIEAIKHTSLVLVSKSIPAWTSCYKLIKDQVQSSCLIVLTTFFGRNGFAFYDFGKLEYIKENLKPGLKNNELNKSVTIKCLASYPALVDIDIKKVLSSMHIRRIPKGLILYLVLSSLSSEEVSLTKIQESWKNISTQCGLDESLLQTSDFENSAQISLYPAIAAVLGGVVSQEIIQAISGKTSASGNWFFFDEKCSGVQLWCPKIENDVLESV